MVLPLANDICVLCSFCAVSLGSLWDRDAILCRMRFVCRHEGPTMPTAVSGCVVAYHSSREEMMKVLPLCLHHIAAVNWFVSNSLMNCSW